MFFTAKPAKRKPGSSHGVASSPQHPQNRKVLDVDTVALHHGGLISVFNRVKNRTSPRTA